MAKMFYDKDCNLDLLKEKNVAVIGYGSQGHAHALNLMESGVNVTVGLYKGSKSWKKAEEKGLRVDTVGEAAKWADVVMMLVNDEKQVELYEEEVVEHLTPGKYLAFAHGFNIHYGQIVPPKDVNVFMVAPKGPGHTVRSEFQGGRGVPCLVTAYQDPSGDTFDLALAYAKGLGGARAGILQTSFKEETETDLFGEQSVLCGGVTELMKVGFEVLVEAGYDPESAYFECVHEMKLIIDMVAESGLSGMRQSISDTAEYGDYSVGKRIITEDTKSEMKKVLEEIQDGSFAKSWILENKANKPFLNARRRVEREHPMEKVGEELRGLMTWAKEGED